MQTLNFDVGGMTCGGCRVKVEHRLGQIAGVFQSTVDLRSGIATVVLDPELVTVGQVISVIKDAGFSAAARPSAGAK